MKSFCPIRQFILEFISNNPNSPHEKIERTTLSVIKTSRSKIAHALRRLLKYSVLSFKEGLYSINPSTPLTSLPEELLFQALLQKPLSREQITKKFKWSRSQTESSLVSLRSRKAISREGNNYFIPHPQLALPFPTHNPTTPKPIPLDDLIAAVQNKKKELDLAKKTSQDLLNQADIYCSQARSILTTAQNSLDEAKKNLRNLLGDLI